MNATLRIFAGIIDFLQFMFFIVFLAFQLMTPVGGGIGGALTGAALCYNLSSGVASIINAATCLLGGGAIGTTLSAFAIPIGMAIDVCISATFGVLLILALWVTGRFSMMAVIMGFATEMMPGINAFSPGWSLLVHRSIVQYNQKQEDGASSATKRMSFALAQRAAASVVAKGHGIAPALVRNLPTQTPGSTPKNHTNIQLQTKNFDGIRPQARGGNEPHAQTA